MMDKLEPSLVVHVIISIISVHYFKAPVQCTAILLAAKIDNQWMRQSELVLTICFRAEMPKIMYAPVNPSFTIRVWS